MSARFIIVDQGTISESRDEEVRPRKRRRDNDDDGESDNRGIATLIEVPAVVQRDPLYYYDDGELYVRVKDYMFKVHLARLSRSSWFEELMSSHNYSVEGEQYGRTFKNPVVFHLQTANEFRALLWLVYSTSPIQYDNPQPEDIGQWLAITSASSTFMPSFKPWAYTALRIALTNTSSTTSTSRSYLDTCNSEELFRALQVTIEFVGDDGDVPLWNVIINKWVDRLQNAELPPLPAVLAADQLSLRQLKGVAYYRLLKDMVATQNPSITVRHGTIFNLTNPITPRGALEFRMPNELNNAQVMKLLSGYWSLASLWERIRRDPPELPQTQGERGQGCTKHTMCLEIWKRKWTSIASSSLTWRYSTADVLSLVELMQREMGLDSDISEGVEEECRKNGLEEIRNLKERVMAGLEDHFHGCI